MAFGEWAADVLRNPIPPPEETSAVVNSNTPTLSIDSEADTDASASLLDTTETDEMLSIEMPAETFTENDPNIDEEHIEVSTPEGPELPSEKTLKPPCANIFHRSDFDGRYKL